MIRQYIIDNYGFDPHNYTKIFVFNYYIISGEGVDFIRIKKNSLTQYFCLSLDKSFGHTGLALTSRYSDLSYIEGELARKIPYVIFKSSVPHVDHENKWVVMRHLPTRSFIIIDKGQYIRYFQDHCFKLVIRGKLCTRGWT